MIVFEYDGFTLDVDPDEWAMLTVPEQSEMIMNAYFGFYSDRKKEQSKPDEKERLFGHLEHETYREAAWLVWCELPDHERIVLDALGARFLEVELPEGTLGRCQSLMMAAGPDIVRPCPEIKVDTSKASASSFNDLLHIIRHELAHAAFRHPEHQFIWHTAGVDRQIARDIHEIEAEAIATAWKVAAKNRMEERNG